MAYVDKINVNGTNYDLGKPLYYHPITLYQKIGGDYVYNVALTLAIINNSSTPFTSVSQIINEVRSWGLTTVKLNLSGGVYANSKTVICAMWEITQNDENILGVNTDGTMTTGSTNTIHVSDLNIDNVSDGVNQLN